MSNTQAAAQQVKSVKKKERRSGAILGGSSILTLVLSLFTIVLFSGTQEGLLNSNNKNQNYGSLLFNGVSAQPCPTNTPFYGPQTSTNRTTLFVSGDDSTRITEMFYCAMAGGGVVKQHFRGFRAKFEADSGTFFYTWGTLDASVDTCETIAIPEEVMYTTVYSDSNDVEGFVFEGHLGSTYTFRANGNAFSPKFRMLGRPIGFDMYMGYGGTSNQPLQLSIIYNACNCPASFFEETAPPRDMVTYAVSGPPDVATLAYQDNYMETIYLQNCGTYQVTFDPPLTFLTLAKTGATGPAGNQYFDQLTLTSTSATDVGRYAVRMIVSQQPGVDGFSQPYVGTLTSISYEFLVTIHPCTTNLQAGTSVTNIVYTVGQPTLIDGAYTFIQAPTDCAYGLSTSVTNLPFFAQHDMFAQNFKIPFTENRSIVGVYTVTLIGQISVPDDYLLVDYTTQTVQYDFTITILDPCVNTVLNSFTAINMQVSVLGPNDIQDTSPPTDSLSITYGDNTGLTYCSPRQFQLVSALPALPLFSEFLTVDLDTGELFLYTGNSAHVGVYTITLEVYLKNFTSKKVQTTFTATIIECQVIGFTYPSVPDQTYIVYTPAIQFSWSDFGQIPACNHPLTYSFNLISGVNSGSPVSTPVTSHPMISHSMPSQTFTVSTNDPLLVGQYYVEVHASVPLIYMSPQYQASLNINLLVTNQCQSDVVVATNGPVGPITHNIGVTGPNVIIPVYSNSVTGCPFTYEVERVIAGVSTPLTAFEQALITHSSNIVTEDGRISIATTASDFAYDNEVWELRVIRRSTYSIGPQRDGYLTVHITFLDPCWLSPLSPADPIGDPYLVDLYQSASFQANSMVNGDMGRNCNGYSYTLNYISGPLSSPPDPNTIYPAQAEDVINNLVTFGPGTLNNRDWIGTHTLSITSTNGTPGLNLRGNNGAFNSVDSRQFQVIIQDPCMVTSLINGPLIADLAVPVNKTEILSPTYTGPGDSLSVAYNANGSGVGGCGGMKYEILDENLVAIPLDSPLITIQMVSSLGVNQLEQFNIYLRSMKFGRTIKRKMYVRTSLAQYNTPSFLLTDFFIEYRECEPFGLKLGPIADQVYFIGTDEFALEYLWTQEPCDYNVTFSAFIYDPATLKETALPSIITAEEKVNFVRYFTDDAKDKGIYDLVVYAQLQDYGGAYQGVALSTRFRLEIMPIIIQVSPTQSQTDDFDLETKEKLPTKLDLKDQELPCETNMIYSLDDIITTPFGQEMDVKVDLGEAAQFMEYEEGINNFVVHDGQASCADFAGEYEICMEISFKNETYSEKLNECFTFELKDPEREAWVPPTPPEYIPVYDKVETIRPGLELGPYSPDQPIPHIEDLTPTGILTIGWDRKMTKPENITDIAPARVGIREPQQHKAKLANETEPFERKLFGGKYKQNEQEIEGELQRDQDDYYPNERKLNYRYYDWFKNETLYNEWLLVVEALEIQMNPGPLSDPLKLNLTWEMLNYNKDYIWIQLYFEYPERVSENPQYDILEVYFWGTEYFKSDSGSEVRYGTKLERPILRQFDPRLAGFLGILGHILNASTWLLLLFMGLTTGRLLPTWTFINSLQLICHLPLIDSEMASPSAYFLSQLLNVAKFDLFEPYLRAFWKSKGTLNEGFNFMFENYGYPSLYFLPNLGTYLFILLACLAIWGLCLIKDALIQPKDHKEIVAKIRHEAWMNNFTCRVFYEGLLCVTLSAFISLRGQYEKHDGSRKDEKHLVWPSETFKNLDNLCAIVALIACATYFMYVLYLRWLHFNKALRWKKIKIDWQKFKLVVHNAMIDFKRLRWWKYRLEVVEASANKDLKTKKHHLIQPDPKKSSVTVEDIYGKPPFCYSKRKFEPEVIQAWEDWQAGKKGSNKPKEIVELEKQIEATKNQENSLKGVLGLEKKNQKISDSNTDEDGRSQIRLETLKSSHASWNINQIENMLDKEGTNKVKKVHKKINLQAKQRKVASKRHQESNSSSSSSSMTESEASETKKRFENSPNRLRKKQQFYEGGSFEQSNVVANQKSKDLDDQHLAGAVLFDDLAVDPKSHENVSKAKTQLISNYDLKHLERRILVREQIDSEYQQSTQWRQENPRSKTLAYGLRVGDKNSDVMSVPLIYIARRYIYAFSLAFMVSTPSGSVTLLVLSSVFLLGKIWIKEPPMEDWWIHYQFIVNEFILYALCMCVVLFARDFAKDWRFMESLSWIMIFLVISFILFNWAVLVYDFIYIVRLHRIRYKKLVVFRATRYSSETQNLTTKLAWRNWLQWDQQRRERGEYKRPKSTFEKLEWSNLNFVRNLIEKYSAWKIKQAELTQKRKQIEELDKLKEKTDFVFEDFSKADEDRSNDRKLQTQDNFMTNQGLLLTNEDNSVSVSQTDENNLSNVGLRIRDNSNISVKKDLITAKISNKTSQFASQQKVTPITDQQGRTLSESSSSKVSIRSPVEEYKQSSNESSSLHTSQISQSSLQESDHHNRQPSIEIAAIDDSILSSGFDSARQKSYKDQQHAGISRVQVDRHLAALQPQDRKSRDSHFYLHKIGLNLSSRESEIDMQSRETPRDNNGYEFRKASQVHQKKQQQSHTQRLTPANQRNEEHRLSFFDQSLRARVQNQKEEFEDSSMVDSIIQQQRTINDVQAVSPEFGKYFKDETHEFNNSNYVSKTPGIPDQYEKFYNTQTRNMPISRTPAFDLNEAESNRWAQNLNSFGHTQQMEMHHRGHDKNQRHIQRINTNLDLNLHIVRKNRPIDPQDNNYLRTSMEVKNLPVLSQDIIKNGPYQTNNISRQTVNNNNNGDDKL